MLGGSIHPSCGMFSGFSYFFFLSVRRQPGSTLFPSPPLFQSAGQAAANAALPSKGGSDVAKATRIPDIPPMPEDLLQTARSEEHTSELQSRQYLVCRLLLEKKNRYHQSQLDCTDLSNSTTSST